MCVPLAMACQRRERFTVEVAALAGDTVSENAVLDLSRDEIQGAFRRAITAHGGFRLAAADQKPSGDAIQLALELPFTRFIQRDAGAPPVAEVGARVLAIQRRGRGGGEYDGWGAGEVRLEGSAPPERRAAAREAFEAAVKAAVRAAHVQLVALGKSDDALISDLKSKDAAERDAAVRALADRGNTAVVPSLIARLGSEDPTILRRTIGQLVELRDARAVEPLIELSRGKDHGFVRELLYAVGALGGAEAEAYLDTVAAGHDQPAVRRAAAEALGELRARAEGRLGPTGATAEHREGDAE